MSIRKIVRFVCFVLIFPAIPFPTPAEDFTNAIHAFLQHRVEVDKDVGMVIGIIDEQGSHVISYGKLNNDTDQMVDGDTVFPLHSGTCHFTALLLQDMIERGEMKLDDPAARYLPASVKMPALHGKQITLRHLVTETAGLPRTIDNLDPKRADNPLADFTIEKMDAFVSGCQLTNEPGTKHEHGGVAMGLLGQALAFTAGTNYESLVRERICRPLKMDSTRVTLTPELQARLVTEYNPRGYATLESSMDWGALAPLAGLHSTVNDLLKFVSALGLNKSSLTPLMEKSATYYARTTPDNGIVLDYARSGYDQTRRRCVVVASATYWTFNQRQLLRFLLESEWQSDRRPKQATIDSRIYELYVGPQLSGLEPR